MGRTTIDITGDTGEGLESLERALWLAFNSHGEFTIAESYWVGRLKPSTVYWGSKASEGAPHNILQNKQPIADLHVRHMEHTTVSPEGRLTLILCRKMLHPNEGQTPLPFFLTQDNATYFVQQWLHKTAAGERGPAPDTDGDVKPNGWRVYVKQGYSDDVNGPSNGLVAIEPHWTIYGK